MLDLLPAERAAALAGGPVTIDLDITDVEVYGRKMVFGAPVVFWRATKLAASSECIS
jgi:hypothetical protein